MLRTFLFSLFVTSMTACAGIDPVNDAPKAETPAISVSRIRPDPAFFETRGDLTRLNFDFELKNSGAHDVEITFVGMRVYDAEGRILVRRYMGGNGLPGPIAMLPERSIPANGSRYLFNPFPDLALTDTPSHAEIAVSHSEGVLSFQILFQAPPGPVLERLPLNGLSYVFSGNDLFAHHRRVALDSEAARALGMDHIAQRFALDFTRLDLESGDLAANDGAERSDWFGYGAEVFAPIAGRVHTVRSDMPDNSFSPSGERVFADGFDAYGPDRGLGNYVVLDVGGGAYLISSHFKKDSVALNVGDIVEAGDFMGEVGMSGDTAYPHLHMQLQDGPDSLHAKPLPIVFACVDFRDRGREASAVDTGDFVSPCVN